VELRWLERAISFVVVPDLSRCAPRPPCAQALWLVQTAPNRSAPGLKITCGLTGLRLSHGAASCPNGAGAIEPGL